MKLLKWIIKMAKKILNLNTDNGEQSWEDATGGLPSGTENQTLRHNGTEWVATGAMVLYETIGDYAQTQLAITTADNTMGAGGYISIEKNIDTNTESAYIELGAMANSYTYSGKIIFNDNVNCYELVLTSALSGYRTVFSANNIASECLSGSGSALLEATADGTIQRSTATLPTRTEYLSGLLSGTEHTFTGATLGITGDLRSRIKNIKCFAVDSNGDFNGALIANEFIYETDLVVNSATNLSGSFSIKLFIEYV